MPLVFAAPKRGKPPRHFADLPPDERAAAVTELGLPAFRAKQLSTHYYTGLSVDPLTWTDLPAAHRQPIKDALFPPLLSYVRAVSCDGGATVKTLWKLHDGTLVESVLMRYGLRRDGTPGSHGVRSTLCVSSQAGCGMACPFCATGQGGLDRNLSTAEIVDQVRAAAASLAAGEIPGVAAEPLIDLAFVCAPSRDWRPRGPGRAIDRGAASHILGMPPMPFIAPIFFIIFIRPPPRIFFIMSRICSY